MNRQRIIAFLLIAVQAALLGYLSKTVAFPATLCGLALVGTVTSLRISLQRETAFRLAAGLAVVFLVKYRLAPHEFPYEALFVRTQLAHVCAQYVLAMQVSQFFVRRPGDRLPVSLPCWSTLVMVFAADVQVRGSQRLVCQILSAAFLVLAALYVASLRRSAAGRAASGRSRVRWLAQAVFLCVVLAVAWGTSSALARNEREIEGMLVHLLSSGERRVGTGFSGTAHLGHLSPLKLAAENQVALRVFSKQTPGYLRGRVFDEYRRAEWRDRSDTLLLTRLTDLPEGIHTGTAEAIFGRSTVEIEADYERFECWRAPSLGAHLFTPLHTSLLQATASEMVIDRHGVFRASNLREDFPYAAFRRRPPLAETLTSTDRDHLTQLPRFVHPRVVELAATIFAGCETPQDKMTAVERYFHTHHEYRMVFEMDAPGDPLTWFLLRQASGHCEFFASGAALLLRLGGVPCRYVTGFVVADQNQYGGYWVARNRDAHAWVEAYDEERGWTIVEATPGDGVPGSSDVSATREFWEWLSDRFWMFTTSLKRDGLGRLSTVLIGFVTTVPGIAVCLLLAIAVCANGYRRRGFSIAVRHRRTRGEMQQMLDRMDRTLMRRHLTRHPAETLHQFAARLEAACPDDPICHNAANWYRRYAYIRYTNIGNADTTAELKAAAGQLGRTDREKVPSS